MIPYFHPGAIGFGPFTVQPWGAMVAAGFLLGSLLSQRIARRRSLDPKPFWTILLWLPPGAALFGHLGHALFYEPRHYLARPWELLYVWDGLSSYGGFFGCTAIALLYLRIRKLDLLKSSDVLVIGVTLGWAIGRIGCFLAHDHIGRPVESTAGWIQSSLGWLAVSFPANTAGPGIPAAVRFDLGLFDSLLSWILLAALLLLARRPRRPGVLLGTGAILYSIPRFWLDFLRNVDLPLADARYLGLTPAQYAALLAVGLGIFAIHRGRSRTPWPEGGAPDR
jgi:phosphatidylglycerol:prolipoprotein diacylglycerol transferase